MLQASNLRLAFFGPDNGIQARFLILSETDELLATLESYQEKSKTGSAGYFHSLLLEENWIMLLLTNFVPETSALLLRSLAL